MGVSFGRYLQSSQLISLQVSDSVGSPSQPHSSSSAPSGQSHVLSRVFSPPLHMASHSDHSFQHDHIQLSPGQSSLSVPKTVLQSCLLYTCYLHPRVDCHRHKCYRGHGFGHLFHIGLDILTMVASHPSRYRVECCTPRIQVVVIPHSRHTCQSS